jgi:hypothetical protein
MSPVVAVVPAHLSGVLFCDALIGLGQSRNCNVRFHAGEILGVGCQVSGFGCEIWLMPAPYLCPNGLAARNVYSTC